MSTNTNAAPKAKAACPISRAEFLNAATALEANIAGTPMLCDVKSFSTGGLGYYAGQKITLKIGGKNVQCQVGLNISVIGSKELPQD